MYDTQGGWRPPAHISTMSLESLGIMVRSAARQFGNDESTSFPAVNRALYLPFRLRGPLTAAKMWVVNGSNAAGNVDVGIYSEAGSRLVSTGSVARSGTSTIQEFDITDTPLVTGRYYFALACDSTSATFGWAACALQETKLMGCLQEASAFPLPTTATFATTATTLVPTMGLSTKVTI